MGNMSYCRFENTSNDMMDCLQAIYDEGGIESYIKEHDPSEYEIRGIKNFYRLAKEICEFDTFEDDVKRGEEYWNDDNK